MADKVAAKACTAASVEHAVPAAEREEEERLAAERQAEEARLEVKRLAAKSEGDEKVAAAAMGAKAKRPTVSERVVEESEIETVAGAGLKRMVTETNTDLELTTAVDEEVTTRQNRADPEEEKDDRIGVAERFEHDGVTALDPTSLVQLGCAVDDKVEMRDKDKPWSVGFVTQLSPFKVAPNPGGFGYVWDQVRPFEVRELEEEAARQVMPADDPDDRELATEETVHVSDQVGDQHFTGI